MESTEPATHDTQVAETVTLFHNKQCSTSKHALATLTEAGAPTDVIEYLKTPLDEAALRELISTLEDPVTDLVRRDPYFTQQGLSEDQVVAVLLEHPRLMQRPVLRRGNRSIIGRPKGRVAAFIRG